MAGPPPFGDLGEHAQDLLTTADCYDQKFTLSIPTSNGTILSATGVKRGQTYFGAVNSLFKRGNTEVDLKVFANCTMSAKVTVNDFWPCSEADLTFISNHKSWNLPSMLTLHAQYLHPQATIDSTITLNRTPLLGLSATIGSKELCVGGEVGFDTASAACYNYSSGIGFNKPDFSAAVLLTGKGKTLKASYVQSINPSTSVAAEMIHRFPSKERELSFGTSHVVDPVTVVKTRISVDGKFSMLCQREWRPNSLITFSALYDTKAINARPKVGLSLVVSP